jgi:cytochrome c
MSLTARLLPVVGSATRALVAAGAFLLAVPALAAESASSPSPGSSGQGAFNNHCRTCHSVKGEDNRLGPSLAGILGAKAGTRPGYAAYSQAMKTSGAMWDEANLDKFIADPESVVPNNNMKPFKGIPDAAVRKAIIGYLKSLPASG